MLKGQHVGLRAIEPHDLPALLQWRNKPEFRRYFREYRELSSVQQKEWFERIVLGDRNTQMFAICALDSNDLLGACGLCHVDWINRSADFSIYIGYGDLYIDTLYAPDSAKVMISYAFDELQLHRLWAEIYDFDHAKKDFFDKLGFQQEGRFRDTHWSEGSWRDSIFYGLLRTDMLK